MKELAEYCIAVLLVLVWICYLALSIVLAVIFDYGYYALGVLITWPTGIGGGIYFMRH